MCLLHLNLKGALAENLIIMILLPFGFYLAVSLSVRYVRSGKARLTKAETVSVYAAIACLLVFGVVRNIYGL